MRILSQPAVKATDLAAAVIQFSFAVFQRSSSSYELITEGNVVGSLKQTVGLIEQAARGRLKDVSRNSDGAIEITVWEV